MSHTLMLSSANGKEDISRAGDILRNGGVVAIPTETVYGLAANALDCEAVKKIFTAKGRPQDNPLIVHISSFDDVFSLCDGISDIAVAIMKAFWPGPLTAVLKKKPIIPDIVTCGLPNVGIRFPSHRTAREVIESAGVPLAAPSANLSGKPSPTCAAHVAQDMEGRIDAILDGGECEIGVESTVVDLTGEHPVILRPGGVTLEQMISVAPGTTTADFNRELKEGENPLSPGMKYRHYAPLSHVRLVRGDADRAAEYIKNKLKSGDEIRGVMCFSEYKDVFLSTGAHVVVSYGGRYDVSAQSKEMFSAMRAFDETPVSCIYIQASADVSGMGLALDNRLMRAAGFDVINV